MTTAAARPIRGEAHHVQLLTRPGSSTEILRFQLNRFDEEGNALPPIPVEMSGKIQGVLSEGDRVEIDLDWRSGQTLRPAELRNLTTGGLVRDVSIENAISHFAYFLRALGILLILVVVLFLLLGLMASYHC